MISTPWRTEAWLAAIGGVVMMVGGGIALWFFLAVPVHVDSAAVPSSPGTQVERYSDAIEQGRRLARALAVEENVPGLAVAVALDGEIVWAEGLGWADIERGQPVTVRTRFRLGAASKPLTAAAVALLHDRGRLDLDAPVQAYVRDYPQKPWPMTTRQLMGDVAGVHRIRGDNNDAMPDEACANLDEALALFAGEPLMFRPGSAYRYSIWGWILLSVIVERVAAERFGAFMARDLFQPLGMTSTVLEHAVSVPDEPPVFYAGTRSGRVKPVPQRKADYSCMAGAGGFLSTPEDLARFGSAMLRPGLLGADTIRMMQTPLTLESGQATSYALGWRVENVLLAGRPARLVGHRGTPMGGAVSLLTFPDLDIVVAVAANTGASVDPLARELASVFAARRR